MTQKTEAADKAVEKEKSAKDPKTEKMFPAPAGMNRVEPFIYIGPTDTRRQLKCKTAYLRIPEGANKDLFVSLSEYPAWAKTNKE